MKRVLSVLMIVCLLSATAGCGAISKVNEFKDEAEQMVESVDDIKEDAKEMMKEAEEAIEEAEKQVDKIEKELEKQEADQEQETDDDDTTDGMVKDVETADIGDLKDQVIEELDMSIFEVDSVQVAVEEVRMFSEDTELELPSMPDKNYLYITGGMISRHNEKISSERLFTITLYDDLGQQVGDATRWLSEGNLGTEVDYKENFDYQYLYLFDKNASYLDFEFVDDLSGQKVVSRIDVALMNTESRQKDEVDYIAIMDSIDLIGADVLTLIDEGRFDELTDYMYGSVYFLPGPSAIHSEAVYIDREDWATLGESQETKKWGKYEGREEAINLTAKEFFKTFISDHDFLNASEKFITTYSDLGEGDNFWKNDSNGEWYIEYFYPGEVSEFEGLDYQKLYMIFAYDDELGSYVVTGMANDYWTP